MSQKQNTNSLTSFFSPDFELFKLQREVLKFNDICVRWSWPKTDLETNIRIFQILKIEVKNDLTILTGKNCILLNSVKEWLLNCF